MRRYVDELKEPLEGSNIYALKRHKRVATLLCLAI